MAGCKPGGFEEAKMSKAVQLESEVGYLTPCRVKRPLQVASVLFVGRLGWTWELGGVCWFVCLLSFFWLEVLLDVSFSHALTKN